MITIHEEVFFKNGFKKAIENLAKKIESLNFSPKLISMGR